MDELPNSKELRIVSSDHLTTKNPTLRVIPVSAGLKKIVEDFVKSPSPAPAAIPIRVVSKEPENSQRTATSPDTPLLRRPDVQFEFRKNIAEFIKLLVRKVEYAVLEELNGGPHSWQECKQLMLLLEKLRNLSKRITRIEDRVEEIVRKLKDGASEAIKKEVRDDFMVLCRTLQGQTSKMATGLQNQMESKRSRPRPSHHGLEPKTSHSYGHFETCKEKGPSVANKGETVQAASTQRQEKYTIYSGHFVLRDQSKCQESAL